MKDESFKKEWILLPGRSRTISIHFPHPVPIQLSHSHLRLHFVNLQDMQNVCLMMSDIFNDMNESLKVRKNKMDRDMPGSLVRPCKASYFRERFPFLSLFHPLFSSAGRPGPLALAVAPGAVVTVVKCTSQRPVSRRCQFGLGRSATKCCFPSTPRNGSKTIKYD